MHGVILNDLGGSHAESPGRDSRGKAEGRPQIMNVRAAQLGAVVAGLLGKQMTG
jgi:hypothetical protein